MTNESLHLTSEPTETNLHHRQKKSESPNVVLPASKKSPSRQSLGQCFASYFTSPKSEKVDTISTKTPQKEIKQRSMINACFCEHFCLKLILLFCTTYLILFFRPDYSIFLRNSVEKVLKQLNLTSPEYRLRPGQLYAPYRQPSMPIIIIPGIISTGLELWKGTECAKGKFRHRFWTSMQMVDNIGRDHQCWLKHISLNLSTWY